MCLERIFSVLAVLYVACVWLTVSLLCYTCLNLISSLCHAWWWLVVVWLSAVGAVWSVLYVCGVPVGVDGHGDSRRWAAGATVRRCQWSGDVDRTCPVCLVPVKGAVAGGLSSGSQRCRLLCCWTCSVLVVVTVHLPTICARLVVSKGCLDPVARTLVVAVGLWGSAPVLVQDGSAVGCDEFGSYLSERGGTGKPGVRKLEVASVVPRVVMTFVTFLTSSSRGIRVAGTHSNAFCVWMALLSYRGPWWRSSGSCGDGAGLSLVQGLLLVCVSASVVGIPAHRWRRVLRPRVIAPIDFTTLCAHMVLVGLAGLSGGGSLDSGGGHARIVGGMAGTGNVAEQRRAPCLRDDATGAITAAPTGVGVRSRVGGVIVLVYFVVARFLGEVLVIWCSCDHGVCGVTLCVLVSCALVVDRQRAQYRGSCLSHVGRRTSDALRA